MAGHVRRVLMQRADELGRMKVELGQELAKTLPERLRADIRNRVFDYPDNSPATLARKSGDTPLIDTENYINSWRGIVQTRRSRGSSAVSVVVEPVGTNPKHGMSNAALAEVLEHGTSTSPARKHLEPFQEKAQQYAEQRFVRRVIDVFFRS